MQKRIARLTLAFGATAAGATGMLYRWAWAAGLMIGAVLAWLNFRWLTRGLNAALASSMAQAGVTSQRVPLSTYVLAIFRYALIALVVYVNSKVLRVPLASMVVGLCALGAAAVAVSVYEVLHPVNSGQQLGCRSVNGE